MSAPAAGLVILSAGASRRMGRPKALLPLPSGETFLGRIAGLAQAAGIREVVVVLGPPHGAEIRAQAGALAQALRWAWNDAPQEGMLSSVQVGLRALGPLAGALIWPVDVPLVRPETLRLLLAADRSQILLPSHGGRGGHPLWVPADLWPAVHALPPAEGLRGLRRRHPDRVSWLTVDDPGVHRDIDTPEAWLGLQMMNGWKRS